MKTMKNNNNLTNIKATTIIERLKLINKEVIDLETAYEYDGHCCTCPSASITKLIHELEAMITPINPYKLKMYVLEIKPTEKWIEEVHRIYVDTVPGTIVRKLVKDYILEAIDHGFLDGLTKLQDMQEITSWWPIISGYYDPEKTIRVKLALPSDVVKRLDTPIVRASFVPQTCVINFAEGHDPSVMNCGNAAPSHRTDNADKWEIISRILTREEIDTLLEVEGPNYFDDILRLPQEVIRRAHQLKLVSLKLEHKDPGRYQETIKELSDLLEPYMEVVDLLILLKYINMYVEMETYYHKYIEPDHNTK